MRRFLGEMLPAEQGFEVHTARNGEEALAEIQRLDPDVVTLDINMPEMDGVTCLSRIMVESPRPVVMVSSLTEEGAVVTFEALELGAVDYIPKPDGTVSKNLKTLGPQIQQKVRNAARARVRPEAPEPQPAPRQNRAPAAAPATPTRVDGVVIIGVSTGGPKSLERIIPYLAADFPYPVVIAQHIGESFTRLLAERLDEMSPVTVREVNRPTPLVPGEVAIGRGDRDITLGRRGEQYVALNLPPDNEGYLWHPSVDRLVWSALELFPPRNVMGVQLTGMGRDGAEAMNAVHAGGGRTVAESEETAVVYGMPRELVEKGGASSVRPLGGVADQVNRWAEEGWPCP
jgi:two-component system chemotaxis response regulator CheB